jgi:hypothetical protein
MRPSPARNLDAMKKSVASHSRAKLLAYDTAVQLYTINPQPSCAPELNSFRLEAELVDGGGSGNNAG